MECVAPREYINNRNQNVCTHCFPLLISQFRYAILDFKDIPSFADPTEQNIWSFGSTQILNVQIHRTVSAHCFHGLMAKLLFPLRLNRSRSKECFLVHGKSLSHSHPTYMPIRVIAKKMWRRKRDESAWCSTITIQRTYENYLRTSDWIDGSMVRLCRVNACVVLVFAFATLAPAYEFYHCLFALHKHTIGMRYSRIHRFIRTRTHIPHISQIICHWNHHSILMRCDFPLSFISHFIISLLRAKGVRWSIHVYAIRRVEKFRYIHQTVLHHSKWVSLFSPYFFLMWMEMDSITNWIEIIIQ